MKIKKFKFPKIRKGLVIARFEVKPYKWSQFISPYGMVHYKNTLDRFVEVTVKASDKFNKRNER